MPSVRAIILTNESLAFAFGVSLNALLIFLTYRCSSSTLYSYARIIRVHCWSDIFFACCELMLGPMVVTIEDRAFLSYHGLAIYAGPRLAPLFCGFTTWIVYVGVSLVTIDLYYRYQSVCFNKEVSTRRIYALVALVYFVSWLQAFPATLSLPSMVHGPSEASMAYAHELQLFNPDDWADAAPIFSVARLSDNFANTTMFSIVGFVCLMLSIIAYILFRMRTTIQGLNGLAKTRSVRMQRQSRHVTRIIVIQAILPVMVVSVPTFVIIYCAYTQITSLTVALGSTLVAAWLPTVKPLASILIIERYRHFLLRALFPRLRLSPIKSSSADVSFHLNSRLRLSTIQTTPVL